MRRHLSILLLLVPVFISCREQRLTGDESAQLTFSDDTVSFDTIFTSFGSSTRRVIIYNDNPNAVCIERVWWQRGQHFFANIDGENNPEMWQDIRINGGDSIFLFLRAQIDPYQTGNHPIETDTLCFDVNGHRQVLPVQAYGMDVKLIRSDSLSHTYPKGLRLTADKPYLIYDTLYIYGPLIIDPGATLYMHQTASIVAFYSVTAQGTEEAPIRIMGDRTDWLFPQVPYRVASGQWGGVYLLRIDSVCADAAVQYNLSNIQLLSGEDGLYAFSDNSERRGQLTMHNARIHNMSDCGIILENADATITNTEISNCAAYGLLIDGGKHEIDHTSIANYFGYPYTTINIHNVTRQDVAGVYILAQDTDRAPSQTSLHNCIITGAHSPALVIDSIPETGYTGEVTGCYLRADSIKQSWARHNTYAQSKDTVFNNIYYLYHEYNYYDFHLYKSSPARGIGMPLDSLPESVRALLETDLDRHSRDRIHPDAGCYSNPSE
ncbi:MAG: right-handed parallel beta-helix repeat-containing protein [Paludibacteraceae bacterium]|nr:right-handed parallel beta-helix repeat-containing protein [Paludibacteraceae bacterium]